MCLKNETVKKALLKMAIFKCLLLLVLTRGVKRLQILEKSIFDYLGSEID